MQLNFRCSSTASFRSRVRDLATALFALIVFFGTFGAPAHAQEFRGTLSGKVTDSTGAVIPKAKVTVTELNTGTISRTVSDSDGQWVVPFLLPGTYKVEAQATGFQSIVRSPITLQAQEHPLLDLSMPIGESSETVTVTSAAPLIDQANASVGQVISTKSVEDLPLNGRNPAMLVELSVGAIAEIPPQLVHPFDNSAGNSFSLGGTPNQSSEVLLDGSPDLTVLGQLAFAPTEDTVEEVSIRPFDTDASFGHTIGGVINQVTKSGTNRLHGTVYEFNQIPNLDANTFLDDQHVPPTKLPVTHYNQYGLTVGGPVFIPKVYNGKDKLFFFFAYEELKDSTPASTTLTVPTAAERTGDFSALLYAGCNNKLGGPYTVNAATGVAYCASAPTVPDPNQLYNPNSATAGTTYTRTAIANNMLTNVPGFAVNGVAASYLSLYPQPNNTANAAPDGLNNYVSNAPSADTYNSEFGRLDYNLGSQDHVFYDFRHNNRTQTKNDFFGNNSFGSELLRENFGSTIDNVFTLNPTTIFDARFNWTYFDEAHLALSQRFTANSVNLPASLTSSSTKPQLPCVIFSATSATSLSTCGTSTSSFQDLGDDSNSYLDPTTSYQTFVDMVKVIGKHTVKVGFDGRRYQLRYTNYGNSSGGFEFGPNFMSSGNGSGATTPAFGGDLASFEFGVPTAGQYDINAAADLRQYYVGTFAQDDWRVNNELTLNVGFRFDIDTPFGEKFGRTVNGFNRSAMNSVSGTQLAAPVTVTGVAGGGTYTVASINALGGLTFPSANHGAPFQINSGFGSPRVGFSYTPAVFKNKTVIRGGFGIFVSPEGVSELSAAGVVSSSEYINQEGFSQTTNYVATSNSYQSPANTLSNPFPNGFQKPVGSSLGASTFLGQAISFLAPTEHDPYSERWTLGVQQALTTNTLLEVLYVGNHGVHLPVETQNLNAPQLQYLTTNPYRDEDLATAYGKTVTNPFAGKLPNATSCNGATTAVSNLILAYPQFCNAAVTEENQTIGQSYFDSGIVHVEHRTTHGLTLTGNLSLSKLIESDIFLNPEDTRVTEEISPEDHKYHLALGGTYDLPFGKGKAFSFGGSRLWNEVLGGFVINSIYQFESGAPLVFSADIPLAPGATLRSITNQPRDANGSSAQGAPGLNVAAFVTGSSTACPSAGPCNGTSYINGQYADHYRTLPQTLDWVRADGYNNMDASILKNFDLPKNAYLQLRFETFNTLNHPVFAPANTSSATSSTFGYDSTGVIANSLPRQVQLGGRIVF
jgi:hypothetical protein